MANGQLKRLNKLSEEIRGPSDDVLIIIDYSGKLKHDEVRETKNAANKKMILIMCPYVANEVEPSAPVYDEIDQAIDKEIRRLKKIGLSEDEIRAACQTQSPPAADGKKEAARGSGKGNGGKPKRRTRKAGKKKTV
jgi:hypothetical protein